jgi:uncharacterized protein YceK
MSITDITPMRHLLVLLMVAALSGCASTRKYERQLDSWIGHDVNEMLSAWGAPASTFEMPNGNKMYVFMQTGGTSSTAYALPYTAAVVGSSEANWCKTTFMVDTKSKVQSWSHEGNMCRS